MKLNDAQWDCLLELSGEARNERDFDARLLSQLYYHKLAIASNGKVRLTAKGDGMLATIIHA